MRAQNKAPAIAGGGFDIAALRGDYIAEEEAGAIAGASDEAGAIAGADIAASEEDAGVEATGAADEELTTAAEDEDAVTATGAGVPLLKIQIRPMITITAMMMMIQVLRFMGFTLV